MTDPTKGLLRPFRRISRRDFVRVSALAAGGAALGGCSGGVGPAEPPGPPDSPDPPDPPLDITASVGAARGNDLYGATRTALQRIGGIETVVHDGETVFIKPNMVTLPWAQQNNVFSNGECTKVEIIVATAEECLQAGASEVIIGDGSHLPSLPWDFAKTLDGSMNLVAEAQRLSSEYSGNVRVASLEIDSPSWVELPSRTDLGTIAVSSLVANADRVITIPVAKTHSWAQLTLALKNFIGITPLDRYAVWTGTYWDRGKEFDHSSPRAIAEIYLDIVDGLRPDLAIVDFSIGIEGDGPGTGHGGLTVDMRQRLGSWLVLASTDLVAADATAARIMSHDPDSVTQLTMAYAMGLGEMREGAIEIVGESLDDLRVRWDPAVLKNMSDRRGSEASACAMRPGRHRHA